MMEYLSLSPKGSSPQIPLKWKTRAAVGLRLIIDIFSSVLAATTVKDQANSCKASGGDD